MGSNRRLCLIIWVIFVLVSVPIRGQGIKSTRLLDLVIRDYTFKSFNKHFKTGTPYSINLPSNLSGITVYTSRYRCGSLKRYGATINEFYLKVGVDVHPCIERILIVTQNLGNNWSNIYYDNYDALLGYQLVSPVLGLLAYNSGDHGDDTQFEVKIRSPGGIQINFSNYTASSTLDGRIKMCATFEGDGRVKLAKEVAPSVCGAMSQGHFGLVVQSPLLPVRKKMRGWTVAFGCSVGAAIAVFLVGLLLIAMFVKVKKKARLEEMERRAYEEEALQVSMVGHVIRVHTASATRTSPRIEQNLRPPR
ncbi:hypothetical protein HanRHA438_Chr17g0789241 [Helianthus annuus]|uniref:Concanavalin A-like lectin/glucanase domain-containing protein n=2 Tax=Helianthus annuus TaxID=4232 RepID=A0A251RM70_HELAN|nr:hypothetical protein HanXRQr2_Chr17g0778591 [Helianthus annuus]KAJ0427405.1 hypothetical protein HanHA300_Chr17g0634901 [Helianthus annuus]KAJ0431183.1 hypothetical protein HanIR_Chr17g0845631 [Helianthus annuus]KAJ0445682.1 hypothetical protein HanHA89_Chr17g0686151 [Helianthus annuus]KAJ0630650.1 hypothetical protein HanLR1_Chr17g0645591 [Helianthus annuus]